MTYLKVILGYVLLSLILTYPLILEINSSYIGSGDVGLFVWDLWWVRKAFFEGGARLFWTDYMFHPTGVSLVYHTLALYNSFAGVLLQEFFNLAASYNILVLSSYVLSGLGMFMLAKHLTGSDYASFLAGFAFAFSPYRVGVVNAGHLNLAATQWIPLYMLYALRVREKPGLRNVFLAGLFFALTSLSSWQYMGMAVIYSGLVLFHALLVERSVDLRFLGGLFCVLFLGFVFVSPFLFPLFREYFSLGYMRYSFAVFMGTSQAYSLDLSSILYSPLTGGLGGKVTAVGYVAVFFSLYFVYSENRVFPGIRRSVRGVVAFVSNQPALSTIFVLCYLVLFMQSIREYPGIDLGCYAQVALLIPAVLLVSALLRERKLSLWVFLGLSFYVLSLGPVVQVFGKTCNFPLPYMMAFFMPGGAVFRTPFRFLAFFTACLSVLFALGLREFAESRGRGKNVYALVFCLLLVECGFASYALTKAIVPPVYDLISRDFGDYAVLEVPIPPIIYRTENDLVTYTYGLPEFLRYQTTHGKRIIGGYTARQPLEALEFIDDTSPFCQLRNVFSGRLKTECVGAAGIEGLKSLGVRYVIVHEDMVEAHDFMEEGSADEVHEIIRGIFGDARPFHSDEEITAYRID